MNSAAILNLIHFCFPILDKKVSNLIRSLKRTCIARYLETFKPEYVTGTKLGTRFNNIKDPVKKSHHHDVAYYATCLNQAV